MSEFCIQGEVIQVTYTLITLKLHLNSHPGWHQGVSSVLISGVAEVDVSGLLVVEHCSLPLFVCLNRFHFVWFHVV